MSEELVEQQLSRLNGLMHTERTRLTLERTDPELPPEELGAVAGEGFRSEDTDISVSVYVFADWSRHRPVSEQLEEALSEDGVHVVTASNGPMLFVGHTRVDGPAGSTARFALGDIVSAFAGDE